MISSSTSGGIRAGWCRGSGGRRGTWNDRPRTARSAMSAMLVVDEALRNALLLVLAEFLHDQDAVDEVLDDVVLQRLELLVELLLVAGLALDLLDERGDLPADMSSTVMTLPRRWRQCRWRNAGSDRRCPVRAVGACKPESSALQTNRAARRARATKRRSVMGWADCSERR
jgi:hypothetical protein